MARASDAQNNRPAIRTGVVSLYGRAFEKLLLLSHSAQSQQMQSHSNGYHLLDAQI